MQEAAQVNTVRAQDQGTHSVTHRKLRSQEQTKQIRVRVTTQAKILTKLTRG